MDKKALCEELFWFFLIKGELYFLYCCAMLAIKVCLQNTSRCWATIWLWTKVAMSFPLPPLVEESPHTTSSSGFLLVDVVKLMGLKSNVTTVGNRLVNETSFANTSWRAWPTQTIFTASVQILWISRPPILELRSLDKFSHPPTPRASGLLPHSLFDSLFSVDGSSVVRSQDIDELNFLGRLEEENNTLSFSSPPLLGFPNSSLAFTFMRSFGGEENETSLLWGEFSGWSLKIRGWSFIPLTDFLRLHLNVSSGSGGQTLLLASLSNGTELPSFQRELFFDPTLAILVQSDGGGSDSPGLIIGLTVGLVGGLLVKKHMILLLSMALLRIHINVDWNCILPKCYR